MGRWRLPSLLLTHIARTHESCNFNLFSPLEHHQSLKSPFFDRCFFFNLRHFSAIPHRLCTEIDSGSVDFHPNYRLADEDEEIGKIPVKAYFLSTSIDLKSMQAENLTHVVPPSSRSTNYIALRYSDFPSEISALGVRRNVRHCRFMVVFHYGSVVLFNIEDHEVENYLDIIRRHASGMLSEMRKDDYAIKEKPLLAEDMQGGPDYIVLKTLDTDSVRVIGSVLGQSMALDYFVSQVDCLVQEFAGINRAMEKTGTFTMDRTKLLQLVGKANSNLADVILKVGLFERSEIAWRDAKYAQIYEYLREEYEVAQRFGNLDFKLKFVEHNIHFLQEVIQNRRSDLLEWCIIFLLAIENVISVYEIVRDSTGVSLDLACRLGNF